MPAKPPFCNARQVQSHNPSRPASPWKQPCSPTCVAVLNAGHLQHLLGCAGGHDTGTTRGRDQADGDGTTLASNLGGHGVHLHRQTKHSAQKVGTAVGRREPIRSRASATQLPCCDLNGVLAERKSSCELARTLIDAWHWVGVPALNQRVCCKCAPHLSNLVTPVSTANGNNAHLGQNDGTTDSSGNLQANQIKRKLLTAPRLCGCP
jgi:hypothetical protein